MIGALALGAFGFLYRVLSHHGLTNDHYMHLAWAQQLLKGDLPGRDFVDPGMPLMYAASALVQSVWPGPFSEAALSSAFLGVAAAAVCLATTLATRRFAWGAIAALFTIALAPRLYSYPKLLVPGLTLSLAWWYLARPDGRRAAMLGAWAGTAALLRYDVGLYAAIASVVALGFGVRSRREIVRHAGALALGIALVFGPWALAIERFEGIAEHLRETAEFTKGEAHQLAFAWPQFTAASPMASDDDAVAWLFYLAYALPVTIALTVLARRRQLSRSQVGFAAAMAALLLAYLPLILRHPLAIRVPDLAAILGVALVWQMSQLFDAAWGALRGRAGWPAMVGHAAAAGLAAVIAVAAGGAAWTLGRVPGLLQETRLFVSLEKSRDIWSDLRLAGTQWPWAWYWPAGDLPQAVAYVHSCTSRNDRILVTWNAPEYDFFSGRGFAAGHALFLPPRAFTTEADQQRMLARLEERPPVMALINETERPDFARAYPMVEDYMRAGFDPIGRFETRGGDQVTVAIARGARASSIDNTTGWPCELSLDAAAYAKGRRSAITPVGFRP